MRIVVALGGNALLRRGEPMTPAAQRRNVRRACEALAPVAREHELVVSHGNGPQVGLLALQVHAYQPETAPPLDVLGAATEGTIGYLIEQELRNALPAGTELATVLTMTEVDPGDPAFDHPTKPVGPIYEPEEAVRLAAMSGFVMRPDGEHFRRVVASPAPKRIVEIRPITWLVERGCVVICAGGGGIPTVPAPDPDGHTRHALAGVEAVVDKDLTGSLLAREVDADLFVMATDVDGVYLDWGTPRQRRLGEVTPAELARHRFPAGTMGPKVDAACRFVEATGRRAVIGALDDLAGILAGTHGTRIRPDAPCVAAVGTGRDVDLSEV